MLNIIYFSLNMENYKSANYQQEIIDELKNQTNLFLYGPGFENYNPNDGIDEVILKSNFKENIILFVGHSWLSDLTKNKDNISLNNKIDFEKNNLFKVIFLNKEYVNLTEKLNFIKKNKFNLSFTHHHENEYYQKLTNIKFFFIPFSFNKKILLKKRRKKIYDVCFTGILQNQNINAEQSDIRIRIMKSFFYTFFDIPIYKKKKYNKLKIYWNSIPRFKIGRFIKKYFLKNNLTNDQYLKILSQSKITINTLSPKKLISPRYFESIASGSEVLCEKSSMYPMIFKKNIFTEFENDLSDFDLKLFNLLTKLENQDTESNFLIKLSNISSHSWNERIKIIINIIKENE